MFKVGDTVVHPKHGVGKIVDIQERTIGTNKTSLIVLKITDSDLRVLVPEDSAVRVGLRPIMKHTEADDIIAILGEQTAAVAPGPWSRRFKVYREMVASGNLVEIAKVYRDMYRLRFDKDLSFGERRLLDQARGLLVNELALAKESEPLSIEGQIQQIVCG